MCDGIDCGALTFSLPRTARQRAAASVRPFEVEDGLLGARRYLGDERRVSRNPVARVTHSQVNESSNLLGARGASFIAPQGEGGAGEFRTGMGKPSVVIRSTSKSISRSEITNSSLVGPLALCLAWGARGGKRLIARKRSRAPGNFDRPTSLRPLRRSVRACFDPAKGLRRAAAETPPPEIPHSAAGVSRHEKVGIRRRNVYIEPRWREPGMPDRRRCAADAHGRAAKQQARRRPCGP